MILSVGVDPSELRVLGFEGPPVERLDVPEHDGPAEGHPAPVQLPDGDGWIVVAHDASPGTLHAVVHGVAGHAGRWTIFLADGATMVPLSPGYPVPAEFVGSRIGTAPGAFSLRHASAELARIRHDLNNPLTAAMAETQLLRMDSDDEALGVIEAQLRRLRDLIAELSQWRLPR
jgi:hypothetical protein